MLFYFVRHGQTDANKAELLAGSGLDHELNNDGHRQAQTLAKVIRQHVPKAHRIVASKMKRARQTAEYLALQLDLQLEFNHEFREWNLGEWEGKSFLEFGHLLIGEGEPKSGESRKAFYARIQSAWTAEHSDTQPWVVVSHGAVWLALQDLLRIPRFKVHNCALVEVRSTGENWQARILNPAEP